MKRAAIVLAMLLAAAWPPRAGEAQSIFGINFLGEHRFTASARQHALGLSGIALRDTASAVSLNDASLADIRGVTFSLVESFASAGINDGTENADQNRFQLPTVMIAVPLRPGLVLSAGYRTDFEGKGDFSFPRVVEGEPTGLEIYRHRSSLFSVPLSVSWRALPWARLAASAALERGSIRSSSIVSFENALYGDVESGRTRSYAGTSFGLSALVEPHERVSLGAVWRSETGYDVTETFSYTKAALDSSAEGSFTLPMSWGAGASVRVARRLWASASFWTREAPTPDGFPQLEGSIGDETLVAAGVERRGASEGGFFSRLPLRVGFYDDRWHLEYPPGKAIHARFLTVGTGFGMPGGPGAIDVAVELGQIGSIDGNGLEERVLRFVFGLSASEPWSKRKQER